MAHATKFCVFQDLKRTDVYCVTEIAPVVVHVLAATVSSHVRVYYWHELQQLCPQLDNVGQLTPINPVKLDSTHSKVMVGFCTIGKFMIGPYLYWN